MDPGQFLQGRTRETQIRRDAQGRWFNEGQPLAHPNLVRAFDRWVSIAPDGRYCLKNGINWAYISLEGAPYFVRSLRIDPGERIVLSLSDDSEEELVAETLRQDVQGALYCDVHDGAAAARFDRHVAGALLELLDEDEQGVYLRVADRKVRPPQVEDPLRARPAGVSA